MKSSYQLIKTMTKFEKETRHRLYIFITKTKQLTWNARQQCSIKKEDILKIFLLLHRWGQHQLQHHTCIIPPSRTVWPLIVLNLLIINLFTAVQTVCKGKIGMNVNGKIIPCHVFTTMKWKTFRWVVVNKSFFHWVTQWRWLTLSLKARTNSDSAISSTTLKDGVIAFIWVIK